MRTFFCAFGLPSERSPAWVHQLPFHYRRDNFVLPLALCGASRTRNYFRPSLVMIDDFNVLFITIFGLRLP
ncbi:hypothetical protein E4U51_004634 [Claviceps purpurea]|nr:hypothetical protein E4U51_004634 [Claviceps purpurea]